MSNWADKIKKDIRENTLNPGDTFTFSCKMCGNCCRNRGNEKIMLTGLDVFRISQALGMKPADMIRQNCGMYIGDDSHLPIIYLNERDDSSCRLLRKGRCMVQDCKPIVCAIHPLGRYYFAEDDQIHYFRTESCQQGREDGRIWTLVEWLDSFGIRELDDMSKAWFRASMDVAAVTSKMSREKIPVHLYAEIISALYLDYDIQKPYAEQLSANMGRLRRVLDVLSKKVRRVEK